MRPINIDDNLHQLLKIQAATRNENMYQIMNRYVQLGLWYDGLEESAKDAIDKAIEDFLISKD